MTGQHRTGNGGRLDARSELEHDRRRERTLVWKGVLALLVVVAVVLARQYWWV